MGQKIRLWSNGKVFEVEGLGYQSPKPVPCEELSAGEVGFMFANIKTVSDAQIGDTITDHDNPAAEPLPGFQEVKPMVFAGLYPVESHEHGVLRDALEKLRLNDSAFNFEPENSAALGFGFRCGFLGLLHLEIVQERLEREFKIDLITTAPSVRYRVTTTQRRRDRGGQPHQVPGRRRDRADRGADHRGHRDHARGVHRRDPEAARGEARQSRRSSSTSARGRVLLIYELPLNEIVLDFYDRLKSVSRGYASLDYHLAGYRVSPMVKLDVLVAGEPVDALSIIVHRDFAYERGKVLIERLRKLIPRQMFEVALQAAIGNKIDRARDHRGHAQERARQVLRRRHLAQTQAARKAEGRQAAHEARRPRGDPAGSLSGRAARERRPGVDAGTLSFPHVPDAQANKSLREASAAIGWFPCPYRLPSC